MKPIVQTVAMLVLAAAPVAAQDTNGTITATLDLEDSTWNVAGADMPRPSSWSEAGGMYDINLIGTPSASATRDPSQTLMLRFDADPSGTSAMAEDLEVTLTGMTGGAPLTAAPANTDITLTALSVEGTDVVISGSFVAVLTEGDDTELVPADTEGAVALDGNFQATIEQQDADAY